MKKRLLCLLLALAVALLSGCAAAGVHQPSPTAPPMNREGAYTSKEDVAAYLRLYGELPDNFITKAQARKLGWDADAGNLWDVAPGKSIGGDRFGNYEGLLPEDSYKECDIDYQGGYRGAKRLVFGEDGAIYYTDDHYQSFAEVK